MNLIVRKTKMVVALLAGSILLVTACDINDPKLPYDLEGTLNNNGAYLRVLSTSPFDIAEGSDAVFELTFEYYDGQDESLLDDVDFYAAFTSFNLDPAQSVKIPETAQPFLTLAKSAFSENEKGLLEATVVIPITDVTGALGLQVSDIEVEDSFNIRWKLNTTDGRSFSVEDRSNAVSGGFYSSPYFSRVNVVQAIDENLFVGEYEFTQQAPGALESLGLNYLFGETFTAELSVDPDNQLNGRVFSVEPYPAFGGLDPVKIPLAFGQTASISGGKLGTGIGCGAGLSFGAASTDLVLIDIDDDSEFTLVIRENTETDCDVAPKNIVLIATKI